MTALPMLAQYVKNLAIQNGVIIAPDAGSVKKAEKMAAFLDLPLGVMYKRRPAHNIAEVTYFIGEVAGMTRRLLGQPPAMVHREP